MLLLAVVGTTLDVDRRQPTLEPGRQPPGAVPEQAHRRRDQHHPDQRDVQEDGDRQADAEHLGRDVDVQDERREHADHDERGAGDHPSRRTDALDHGTLRVEVLAVLLADPAHQEHLVVHREPEQDREHQHRRQRHDRHGLVDADQARAPAPLEDRDDDAVRRSDTEHVEQRAFSGTSTDRNTIISTRNDSPITAPRNHGIRCCSRDETSSVRAVEPVTDASTSVPSTAAGMVSSRRCSSSSSVRCVLRRGRRGHRDDREVARLVRHRRRPPMPHPPGRPGRSRPCRGSRRGIGAPSVSSTTWSGPLVPGP